MNRTALLVVLALSAVFGTLFAFYPQLDLALASFFVKSHVRADMTFGLRTSPLLWLLRDASIWVSALLVTPALAAIGWKLLRPRSRMIMPARAAVFLIVTLALGPGLLTNVLLKPHWGRSRPVDVTAFNGAEHFVAWWDPRGDCLSNCSFVSGDVSGAFWTLAAAAVAPAPWRPAAYIAALTFGGCMSLMRMAAGAHFPSDVFFAGSFTFIIVWLVYAFMYRWPSTRTTDQAIEHALERTAARGHVTAWLHRPIPRFFSRARALARYHWSRANLAAPVATILTALILIATLAALGHFPGLARRIVDATLALTLIAIAVCVFYLVALLRLRRAAANGAPPHK